MPGLYGYVSATKWMTEIELTTWEAFNAYWVPLGWSKTGPILTQSRIDVPRNGSTVTAGQATVAGVAWAPTRGISKVEVAVDGAGWAPAQLSVPLADTTWIQWRDERGGSDGLASNLGTRHGRHRRAAGREPDSAAARRRARLAHDLGGGGLSEQRDAEQIAQVVAIAREVFGASLLGAYLHGSSVLGGMLRTSDVDVLAVIDRTTT